MVFCIFSVSESGFCDYIYKEKFICSRPLTSLKLNGVPWLVFRWGLASFLKSCYPTRHLPLGFLWGLCDTFGIMRHDYFVNVVSFFLAHNIWHGTVGTEYISAFVRESRFVGMGVFTRLKNWINFKFWSQTLLHSFISNKCCAKDRFIHCGNHHYTIYITLQWSFLRLAVSTECHGVHVVSLVLVAAVLGGSSSRWRWSGLRAHQWHKLRLK